MATEVVSPHPKNNSLVVPVYLNQRFVFDLIAMKQDGISTIQKITSSETTQVGNRDQYEGKFGLGQALSSLLKIDISGSRAKELKVGARSTNDGRASAYAGILIPKVTIYASERRRFEAI